MKNVFIRGSVVRYVHLPGAAVDTALLEDATRRGTYIRAPWGCRRGIRRKQKGGEGGERGEEKANVYVRIEASQQAGKGR